MKSIRLFLFLAMLLGTAQAQSISRLHETWGQIGKQIIAFQVKGDKIHMALLRDRPGVGDFEDFFTRTPFVDSTIFQPLGYERGGGKLYVGGEYNTGRASTLIYFVYDSLRPLEAVFVGNVFEPANRESGAVAFNNHCDTLVRACHLKLHRLDEFAKMKQLKPLASMSKADFLSFLQKLPGALAGLCNHCGEGFIENIAGNLLVSMGYQPFWVKTGDDDPVGVYKFNPVNMVSQRFLEDPDAMNAIRAFRDSYFIKGETK